MRLSRSLNCNCHNKDNTYKISSNDVPVLSIILEVWVVHERIIFQNSLPLLIVFLVLASELFNRYLVSIVVLEAQVRECSNLTLQRLSQFLSGLVVPDEVALAVVLIEVIIEEWPVGRALHVLPQLPQDDGLLLVLAQPGGPRARTVVTAHPVQ